MKLMLILFSIFTINNLSIEDSDKDEFLNQMLYSYDEYALVDEYTNNYYDLELYVGKIRNKIYYGVYFKNKIPNQPYFLKLSYDNKNYVLKENPRGDVIQTAVDLNGIDSFSLEIYDKNNYRHPIPKFQNIVKIDIEDFDLISNKISGEGNGVMVQKLRSDFLFSSKLFIYSILVFILFVCSTIILVFYKKKRGMFNSDIKSANVFNFKEFINASKAEIEDSYEREYVEAEVESEELHKEEESQAKERLISHTYVWQHYEEEKSDFNIKKHLEKEGLNTNYQTATLEEKNKVMIELMKLKDQNKITHDDYLDEISELWKSSR